MKLRILLLFLAVTFLLPACTENPVPEEQIPEEQVPDEKDPEETKPPIIQGGDFSEGSEEFWTKVRLQSQAYEESYMTIDDGVLAISFPENTNIGFYQPIELKAGATYKFSADFESAGGCTSGRFFFCISQREPYEGEYFEEDWGMYAMTDAWAGASSGRNLKDPLSGVMPEISGGVGNDMARNGEFTPTTSGQYYFVIAAATWSGVIESITVDNIEIVLIDEGPGDEPGDGDENWHEDATAILAPRSHEPAFVEPGGKFTVELRGAHAALNNQWKSVLKNDLHEWDVEIKSFSPGKIHHGTEDGVKLEIAVPASIPPELMELVIYTPSGTKYRAVRAVSIVPDFEESFYIIHQSDQHMTVDNAVEPGGKSSTTWGNGSKQALQWLTPIVYVINPRFVLHTGDNAHIYNEADSWAGLRGGEDRLLKFMEGLSGYQVPTILITGNHDIGYTSYEKNLEWRKVYFQNIGRTTFSFTMGSFYFLGNEWTNSQFLSWAKEDYFKHYNNPAIKYKLLASHYYDGIDANTTIAPAEKPADLLLVGHIHTTRVVQQEPYPVLAVATAQEYQRSAFFFFERTLAGWSTAQPASHANGVNVHRLVGDWGDPTVAPTFSVENDGTAESNSVSINNKLPFNFYNGRVRFLMKKGEYSVSGGEILATYDYDNGSKTAVLVKVNIKQSGVTQLSIGKK